MEADSPVGMVPMIRNILGGFLFTGDDILKRAAVLSGGERTRLAVARMLLRPANTLLLDEPTNHLDLDSKDVLLEALEDFGGTLIFVSHDRYFVDRLATKIIAVGHGDVEVYPGTYEQFLWSRTQRQAAAPAREIRGAAPAAPAPTRSGQGAPRPQDADSGAAPVPKPAAYADKKRADAAARRQRRVAEERHRRIADLEARIAEREQAIRQIEAEMAAPGFYEARDRAEAVAGRHQALMWEVGDLMNQWEALQTEETSEVASDR